MPVKLTKLSLNLPFGLGGVEVVDDESQKLAAWELYVEYSTRIATQKLDANTGTVREALNSLHSLFETTRKVLKTKGPGTIRCENSVGIIAIKVLNEGIRPFVVKWHTSLSAHENQRLLALQKDIGPGVVVGEDIENWDGRDTFYVELEQLRESILEFVDILATIAEITFKNDHD
jgi:hypothetical protein